MPEGYYTGDQPNPNLKSFVEQHLKENPYHPETDDYNTPAFDQPIDTTKATAIYNMHTYWSKKPHDAIRQYIRHYTKPGDLVLDPFCGSGGTALAALMEGRKAIAIDRSPAATFITKNYCTPVDADELQEAFEELKAKVKPEIDWLYETRCDRCGGKAATNYTVYSQVFQCPRCLEKVPLFDCIEVEGWTQAGKPKKIKACPHCYKKGQTEEIKTTGDKFGAIPVLVSYHCENGCKPKREVRHYNDSDPIKRDYFERYDLAKIREIEGKAIPYWYPIDRMMHAPEDQECWGVKWRAGTSNFRTVDELFTKRNLWALAVIRAATKSTINPLSFVFCSLLLNGSKMQQVRYDLKGNISQGAADLMKGTYYIPQSNKEINTLYYFESRLNNIINGLKEILGLSPNLIISCQSITDISPVKNNSIDYIFTDPPYAEKVQYGELNFIWEAWLGFDTHWHDEEIIVNEVRGKTVDDWRGMMSHAMAECYRVLKPGRWLSLCYHDTSEGTWEMVQDIMAEVGFIPDASDRALFIDTGQKSYNQLTADKVNIRDLVINFRKPRPDETVSLTIIEENEDAATFAQKAHAIIRDYLSAHPGSSKDRIYDELVSRMVRRGQMEAHNFDELLRQVADEVKKPVLKNMFEYEDPDLFGAHEVSHWYLKEGDLALEDESEIAREDAAAKKLEQFMEKWLKDNPHKEGVHYSDLFEQYIYAVKEKPRRQLIDWLPDYFYKTLEGAYRLPASDEERSAKEEARHSGQNRRIKRYVSYLENGLPVPDQERPSDATLAEWIRICKRSGMYARGKYLYEQGGLNLDRLSEEAAVNVEEDYLVCVRSLSREQAERKQAKRTRKKGGA
ncbi:MAG: DNA methyltransferase [Peptococcaceae bacterium]